jgi:YegS/Rv2252/BmrU family lipid kinase
MKNFVIVNPNSANRKTEKEWKYIEKEIRKNIGDFDFKFTSAPFEATSICREAVKAGYQMIISVGGDGTLNEVVNGFFENEKMINPDVVLGIISRGTGCDLIKTLSISKEIDKAIERIKYGNIKKFDIGKIIFLNKENREITRYFINIADFGIGGEIVERVNRTTKIFGGFISFLWGTLITALKYKEKFVEIYIDDEKKFEGKIKNVAVANGKFFGGGMQISPLSKMDDGILDIIIIPEVGYYEGIKIFSSLYKGKILENKKIKFFNGKKVFANSNDVVLIDVDGEQPGKLPAKFEILENILNIKY